MTTNGIIFVDTKEKATVRKSPGSVSGFAVCGLNVNITLSLAGRTMPVLVVLYKPNSVPEAL
jgi:hypothetical protein